MQKVHKAGALLLVALGLTVPSTYVSAGTSDDDTAIPDARHLALHRASQMTSEETG
jgi:hypothetical protein